MSVFETGIRPAIDAYLLEKSKEQRDYGEYWSASSAGYCMRRNIFERLKIPYVTEDARKQRVFEAGHIFHKWVQEITKNAGLSIAQELELQDESLMVRGHIDDLVLIDGMTHFEDEEQGGVSKQEKHLILYDYKTQNSRAFTYQKDRPISYFHRMQLGTYLHILRNQSDTMRFLATGGYEKVSEGRILRISKDDLRMSEDVLEWSDLLKRDVTAYWQMMNEAWGVYRNTGQLPPCSCHMHEGGVPRQRQIQPLFLRGRTLFYQVV